MSWRNQNIICAGARTNSGSAVIFALNRVLAGCASPGGTLLPAELERNLAADGTSEDHEVAATLYEKEAQQLETEAARSEDRVKTLERMALDPQGFQRSHLLSHVRQNRKHAGELQALANQHVLSARQLNEKKP
jgi:hypothetical protein